jgi:hypothetical protein
VCEIGPERIDPIKELGVIPKDPRLSDLPPMRPRWGPPDGDIELPQPPLRDRGDWLE